MDQFQKKRRAKKKKKQKEKKNEYKLWEVPVRKEETNQQRKTTYLIIGKNT